MKIHELFTKRISLTFICKKCSVKRTICGIMGGLVFLFTALEQIISYQVLASFQDPLDLDFKSYYDEMLML